MKLNALLVAALVWAALLALTADARSHHPHHAHHGHSRVHPRSGHRPGLSGGARNPRVLMRNGYGTFDTSLRFSSVSPNERFQSWGLTTSNADILSSGDVHAHSHFFNKRVRAGGPGTCQNISLEFEFHHKPGLVQATFYIVTTAQGRRRMYKAAFTPRAIGMTLLDNTGAIVSGDANALTLTGAHLLSDDRTSKLTVVSDFGDADGSTALIRPLDAVSEKWHRYFNWDESCPTTVLATADGGPQFERSCGAGFTPGQKEFVIHSNYARVGCGSYVIEFNYPDVVVDGEPLSTELNVKIDADGDDMPVVLECAQHSADFYGAQRFPVPAYNVKRCSTKADVEMMGMAHFSDGNHASLYAQATTHDSDVDQTVMLLTNRFAQSERELSLHHAKLDTLAGASVDAPRKVVVKCNGGASDGHVLLDVSSSALAAHKQRAAALDDRRRHARVVVDLPHLPAAGVSVNRVRELGELLVRDGALASLVSTRPIDEADRRDSRMQCADSALCHARILVQRLVGGGGGAKAKKPSAGVRVELDATLPDNVTIDSLKALIGANLSARTYELDMRVVSVRAGEDLAMSAPEDGSASVGLSGGVIALLAVVGALGLISLVAAVVFFVMTDHRSTSAARYFGGVVRDNYGRGALPSLPADRQQ